MAAVGGVLGDWPEVSPHVSSSDNRGFKRCCSTPQEAPDHAKTSQHQSPRTWLGKRCWCEIISNGVAITWHRRERQWGALQKSAVDRKRCGVWDFSLQHDRSIANISIEIRCRGAHRGANNIDTEQQRVFSEGPVRAGESSSASNQWRPPPRSAWRDASACQTHLAMSIQTRLTAPRS